MPTITMPEVPQVGIPEGTKQTGKRVDFRPEYFDLAIETKGYLLLWERAAICPCIPVVTQTEQPNPNCPLCKGSGWIYFGASEPQDLSKYQFDELQKKLITNSGGMIIRGIITAITANENNLDVMSRWVQGSANLTVRNGNRLGYYDKITTLDAEIVFSQVLECDGTNVLTTRYPVVGVNLIKSLDKVYTIGVDFHIDSGVIVWLPNYIPAKGVRVTVHYLCHPVWLIVEHPHAARVTLKQFKTTYPRTPTGDARQLPIQAIIRYDFLPPIG